MLKSHYTKKMIWKDRCAWKISWNDVGTWQLNAATATQGGTAPTIHRCTAKDLHTVRTVLSKRQRLSQLAKLLQPYKVPNIGLIIRNRTYVF